LTEVESNGDHVFSS